MLEFSFIHISDIHLGRPFSDLPKIGEKLEICNSANAKSFNKIIEIALEKTVDFVLIAGDSFDNDEHDLSAKLLFIKNLKKLADNGIKTYVICGNHDPIEMYKKFQNYFRFEEKYKDLINITGVTTNDYKASFSPINGVNIHSVSFKTEEMGNPVEYMPKLNLTEESEYNIGLIHCDLDKKESKYAPVSREDLRKLGYDYYALGHIHIPSNDDENMVYSGTIQARTKKEKDEHGCFYIKVKDKKTTKEFIPADFVRFSDVETDCSNLKNKLEIFENITKTINKKSTEDKLYLFNVKLVGVSEACEELIKTDNLLDEYIEISRENNLKNAVVYNIENELTPDVYEGDIKNDKGIIGIISNGSDEVFEEIYKKIFEIHEAIYKNLELDSFSKEFLLRSLEEDKNKIIDDSKKEILMLCKEIYNSEE